MGGHAAWRKRVARGELAKGAGGAALRHRPRWGRRGADLALNRKGNLGGHGNPKKKSKRGLGSKEEVLQKSHTRIMLSVVAVVAAVFGLISLVSFTFLRIGSLHNEKSVILKDTVGVGSIKETIVQTPPQGP